MKTITRNTLLMASLIILDQLLKAFFLKGDVVVNLGIATLQLVTNTGASFGMFQNNNTLLAWFSLIVLGIIMMSIKQIKKQHEIPAVLIVSGLLGNLVDRVFRGFVVDFIDLHWWPVFNLADSCIVVGVVWLGVAILSEDFEKEKKPIAKTKKKKI